MSQPTRLIAARFGDSGGVPFIVREAFADVSPEGTEHVLETFGEQHLGGSVTARPHAIRERYGTVETLIDDGEAADAHEPSVGRAMTSALADLVARSRPLTVAGVVAGLGENPLRKGGAGRGRTTRGRLRGRDGGCGVDR